MVGLGLIDLSAAFDCVDTDLLLAKTKLYKFSQHAQQFMWSFMEGRLQVTEVQGSTSSTLHILNAPGQGRERGFRCGRGTRINLWAFVVPNL